MKTLFAVLNWGLGHATRSMPVIDKLLEGGAEVILASDGRAMHLLHREYPQLKAVALPGYDINYEGNNMLFSMLRQSPKIRRAIAREHRRTRELVKELKIDAIISDNRPGCYCPGIPSAYITHQLYIPVSSRLPRVIANFSHHFYMKNFTRIWVPDYPEAPGLAGKLSHQHSFKNVDYLGPLSRMKKEETPLKYDAVAVLSGPEPQRSLLEEKVLEQMKRLKGRFAVVGGKTESSKETEPGPHIHYFSFLTHKELNALLLSAKLIICRSGYSSLMDLAVLKKPALLIPTPGQPEQEYLAELHKGAAQFCIQHQNNLKLESAIVQ